MLAEERHRIILELLKEHNVVKLQDICERTQCSESSGRREAIIPLRVTLEIIKVLFP
ncbi:hypothetical protein [Ligilactobacillus salivarius]|uniref:hypothetical protein n=1 Tax=Ligilactobacillus salivarius TaxID=1624 RepID=UPI003A523405